jgi:hypothetical protein
MRQTIAAAAAALALTVTAAPAMACYNSCAQGFNFGVTGGYGYDYGTTSYAHSHREHLPDPTGPWSYYGPQYYYVNQGPIYTGPGNVAPVPTYQERAVSGWYAYSQPYYYGYTGGPYGNATSHYYDGVRIPRPGIYSRRALQRAYRYHRAVYHTPRAVRLGPRPHPHHHQRRFDRPGTKYYYTSRPGPRVVQRNGYSGYAKQHGPARPRHRVD